MMDAIRITSNNLDGRVDDTVFQMGEAKIKPPEVVMLGVEIEMVDSLWQAKITFEVDKMEIDAQVANWTMRCRRCKGEESVHPRVRLIRVKTENLHGSSTRVTAITEIPPFADLRLRTDARRGIWFADLWELHICAECQPTTGSDEAGSLPKS